MKPQRVIFTTTIRKAFANEPSGHVYVYEPEIKRIIHKGSIVEPPYREIDPNPRGGLRGGKGIAFYNGEVFLANSLAIFRFNSTWQHLGVITHPSCAGIHDILVDENGFLWVSSARNDLLFKFSLDGTMVDFINFRQQPVLGRNLEWNQKNLLKNEAIIQGSIDFRDPRSHELAEFDGAHVNSVSPLQDGKMLVSMGFYVNQSYSRLMMLKTWLVRRGLWSGIVKWNSFLREFLHIQKDMHSQLVVPPAKGKSAVIIVSDLKVEQPCLVINQTTAPSHSLLVLPDGTAVYLNTTRGEIIHFSPGENKLLSSTKLTDNFLRGVARLNNDEVIIGAQNRLITYHLPSRKVKDQYQFSENAGESVFAIQDLDEKFNLPPVSFDENVGSVVGFSGNNAVFQ